MRARVFCLIGLLLGTAPGPARADMKLSAKAAPGATETRYFTSIDGLMNGNADIILKETRQGKTVTSAVLDVCYPAAKGSDRKDRFVANLAATGPTLTGTTQSLGDKLPVSVKLTRRPTGDRFEFKGEISVGQTVTEVNSSDNSDISEKEFLDNQATDDGLMPAPKDFTEVSPEAVGIRLKLEAAADFLKGLRGQDVEIALGGLIIGCDALRAGQQTINLTVDPERAAALIAKARATPGVVSAGWTSGLVDMERTIRFPAAEWRDGDRINKDRLAASIARVLTRTMSAQSSASAWSSSTGKLTVTLKRASDLYPTLGLTDVIEITALVAPDRPGGSDRLMLWIGNPVISTVDESAGPKLNLIDESADDEETDPSDDNGSVEALAREFHGQRWDVDKSAWK
jgi:hypothetical protein